MDAWVFWIIAAVILAVGEIVTLSFYLGPFAVGAAVAAVVAGVGGGDVLPWVAFIVASLVVLGVVRPIARSHTRQAPRLRTGTAALVGSSATVVQRISNDEGAGSVRLGGEVWTARSYDEDEVIDAGKRVHVVEIRGATALVSE